MAALARSPVKVAELESPTASEVVGVCVFVVERTKARS